LSILNEIRQNLDSNSFSCGVFVDLEKAFDTVNHKILLKKLEHYGIRSIANNWFDSYLSGRKQFVNLGGINSNNLPITCGVPQGSILGPLLFIIYINDMHSAIKFSKVHHFADDTNLLFSHKNPKILRKRVNADLELLFDWLCANRLSLNVGKTEFVIFRPVGFKNFASVDIKCNSI
jgi:retron-type reverse transcriptase